MLTEILSDGRRGEEEIENNTWETFKKFESVQGKKP